MDTVDTSGRVPRARGLLVPAVTWLVAVGALAVLPAFAHADPDLAVDLARAGSVPWWVLVATVTGQGLALVRVRSAPVPVLLVVAGLALGVAFVQPTGTYSVTSFAVVVAVYLVAVRRPVVRVRWAMLATFVLVGAGYLVSTVPAASGAVVLTTVAALAQACALVLGPLAVAYVVTARRDVREAQRNEVRALARERDALVQAAVAEERTAIARELHDIAAHHMSGIAVMASAIERQIDPAPAEAKAGIRQVREQSKVVLQDLRRVVGLMRDDEAAGTSVQSLAAVPELVTLADRGDGQVTLDVRRREDAAGAGGATGTAGAVDSRTAAGLGAGVGPLAQLTGYRMVQESLANVARHAPGAACSVELDDSGEAAVVLRVRNAASAWAPHAVDGGGLGLRGMRERAELVGADLRYGPTIDGGWQVQLTIPRDPASGAEARAGAGTRDRQAQPGAAVEGGTP